MPLQYKLPGYIGNSLLLVVSVVMLFQNNVVVGLLMGALSLLNLFLIFKLDTYSRDEGILAHELQMVKMREELAIAQKRLRELDGEVAESSRPVKST
jgi:hypothetical protein